MFPPRRKSWKLSISCEPRADHELSYDMEDVLRRLTVQQFLERVFKDVGRRLLDTVDAYDGDDLEAPLRAEDLVPAAKMVLATKGAGPPVVVQHLLRTRKGLVFLPTERSARGFVELDARPLVDVAAEILGLRQAKPAADAVLDLRRRLLACASASAATDSCNLSVETIEQSGFEGETAKVDLTANLWAAIRPTFGKRLVCVALPRERTEHHARGRTLTRRILGTSSKRP